MKIISTVSILFLVWGCLKAQDIVPLQNGNKWIYDVASEVNGINSYYTENYEVIGDTNRYGKNFKIIRITNTNDTAYTFWHSDSIKFSVIEIDGDDMKYDSRILHDTTLINGTLIIDTCDFLEITDREVQKKSYEWSMIQHFWTSSYFTALDFGPILISGSYTDDVLGTSYSSQAIIKGAVINDTVYGDTVTSVENYTIERPLHFQLYQNYPNPFNPTTIIKYSIPSGNNLIILKVFDVLGNEVATLVNKEKPAGEYKVNFNASRLASGIYFYQLIISSLQSKDGKAGSFAQTRKMILLK